MVAVWFFQEIACPGLHRAYSRLNISLGGHDNYRQVISHGLEPCLPIQAAHAWPADVEQDTASLERPRCRQELVRAFEGNRLEIRGAQQAFKRTKDRFVIIKNIHCSFN